MKQNEYKNNRDSNSYKNKDKSIISELSDGDYFNGTVKILRHAVPGPVILSVTDGTKIVVGAPGESISIGGTFYQTGAVYAYEYNGSAWSQYGSTLYGYNPQRCRT